MPAEPICLSRCGSYAIDFGDGQALVLAPLEAAPVRDQRHPWLIMRGRPDRLAMPAQKITLMTCLESSSQSLKIAHHMQAETPHSTDIAMSIASCLKLYL